MQFSFQRRTDLALQALNQLHGKTSPTPGTELADSVGSTVSYLPQVMAPLIKSGWVTSDRGPNGGYTLATDLDQISLLDVVETFEGPILDGTCVLRGGPCPGEVDCALHSAWSQVRDTTIHELSIRSVVPNTLTRSRP